MLVRYFGAAQAAAGTAEEHLDLDGATLDDVIAALQDRYGRTPAAMGKVLARSSFLLNEVALRDRSRALERSDVLDILPPFAGG
ncbi:MoaD/ThiS family protein [Arthrobacter sp. Br18]|uniref:MoaD/ThiS family protein n=1 Tax=Arthrobacter sp. Br18 TaxID=1312954 RepID=UPI00047E4B94|nr:MoaD/ThiS family protein [Arthrobacter sp. Br18]